MHIRQHMGSYQPAWAYIIGMWVHVGAYGSPGAHKGCIQGAIWFICGPRCAHTGPHGSDMGEHWAQYGPRRSHTGPMCAQYGTRIEKISAHDIMRYFFFDFCVSTRHMCAIWGHLGPSWVHTFPYVCTCTHLGFNMGSHSLVLVHIEPA